MRSRDELMFSHWRSLLKIGCLNKAIQACNLHFVALCQNFGLLLQNLGLLLHGYETRAIRAWKDRFVRRLNRGGSFHLIKEWLKVRVLCYKWDFAARCDKEKHSAFTIVKCSLKIVTTFFKVPKSHKEVA